MKLGFPTHPRKSLKEEISWIGENGFDFVDLFLEPDVCDYCQIDVNSIKHLLTSLNLGKVGHTPWYLPIGSAQKELRNSAVELTRNYLRTFSELECSHVTLHANWPSSMFSSQEGIEFQLESLNKIIQSGEELGITILYEPVGTLHESPENLAFILAKLPKLAFHLDIGHFNLNLRNPGDFAEKFSPRLRHVHLHDNDGSRDQHLPLGAGKIDWANFIPRLKKVYDGTITLEIFTKVREYVLLSRTLFLKYWNNA